MTIDLNLYYAVDVSHGQKVGPKRWVADGRIFRRDTGRAIDRVYGEGTSMTAADRRVVVAARKYVRGLDEPDGWNGGSVLPV